MVSASPGFNPIKLKRSRAGPIAEWSKSYADLDRGWGDPGLNPGKGWRTKWKPY